MAKLKLYVDRMSQPSRAIIIFCKMNKIDFEEVKIYLAKGEHLSPGFKAINPMGQVPAIVDGKFALFESHAILRYLACAFPEVSDHWFPADLASRAKIDSILDWHHSNLRRGAAGFIMNTVLAPSFNIPLNPIAAAEFEKILSASLEKIESFWLKVGGKFLLGNLQPSIADLSLVCEIMQLQLLNEDIHQKILRPYDKVRRWIENVQAAASPHFQEVHGILYKAQAKFRSKKAKASGTPSKL